MMSGAPHATSRRALLWVAASLPFIGIAGGWSVTDERHTELLTNVADEAAVQAALQTYWRHTLERSGVSYEHAQVTIFRKAVASACSNSDQGGSFYCASERTVYLDLSDPMIESGVEGHMRVALILAHELSHHAQHQLSRATGSAMQELHADCFAGISWKATAASRLHREIQQEWTAMMNATPESSNSGRVALRVSAFGLGARSGSVAECTRRYVDEELTTAAPQPQTP